MAPPHHRSRSRSRSRTPSKRPVATPMSKAKSIVALVNLKSGGRRCAVYIQQKLTAELGADRVHVLFTGAPAQYVTDVEDFFVAHKPDVVVVAGGDGTISFVMDVIKSLHDQKRLPAGKGVIAPFPLGTGNDLCVSLGFGSGFARWLVWGSSRFRAMQRRFQYAVAIPVNRWQLTFQPHSLDNRTTPSTGMPVTRVMNNYLSIGFDAAVAERLNAFRARHPHLFFTRPVIKLWYAAFAAMALFTEGTMNEQALSVRIDGVAHPLPRGIKALVVSNMLTYAGGSPMWRDEPDKDLTKPSMSDDIVEVTTLNGVWHLALVRLGLGFATKVGQGKHVQVQIRSPCRMQYDGEPINGLFDSADGARRQYNLDISYYTDSAVLEARRGAVRPTFFSVYWPLVLTAVGVVLLIGLLLHCKSDSLATHAFWTF